MATSLAMIWARICGDVDKQRVIHFSAECNKFNNLIIDHLNMADKLGMDGRHADAERGYEAANHYYEQLVEAAVTVEESGGDLPEHICACIAEGPWEYVPPPPIEDRMKIFVKQLLLGSKKIFLYLLAGATIGFLLHYLL